MRPPGGKPQVTASFPSSSPKPRLPTKAPPCRGGERSSASPCLWGRHLRTEGPLPPLLAGLFMPYPEMGMMQPFEGGKMKKSSKILNSFTALRDLLGHWG